MRRGSRNTTRRWVLPAAIVGLVAGGVAAGLILTYTPPPLAVRRTPDGSLFSIEQVSWGRIHRFQDGSWGQRFFHAVIPSQLGPRLQETVPPADTEQDALVCWLRRRPSESPSIPRRIATVDEHGCELTLDNQTGAHYYPQSGGGICAIYLATFPRRQPSFTLRIQDDVPEVPVTLAEFPLPNPLAREFPVWTPEPLPATRSDGNLSVTLRGVTVNLPAPPGEFLDDGKPVWTRLTLGLSSSGSWEIASARVLDATGNVWRTGHDALRQRGGRARREIWLRRSLCPYEPAWKVRLEFAPPSFIWYSPHELDRLPPGVLQRVTGIPVPPPGATQSFSRGLRLDGIPVELYKLVRKSDENERGDTLTFHLRDQAVEQGRRVVLSATNITDQRGRQLGPATEGWGGHEHTVSVALPPGARTITLSLVGRASRVFEFTVKPEPAAISR